MHDLATSEPGRVKEMVAKWETWAKRAHVIPWMWKPQYGQPAEAEPAPGAAAGKLLFELKAGDNLAKGKAPQVKGNAITVEAQVMKWAADGVIIAQGGLVEGYSLYVKAGHPAFAVRRKGELTVAMAKDALPNAPVQLGATLAKDGTITLTVDGKTAATAKAAGTLAKQPVDGLQVGQDANGAVGDYEAPFTFGGEIGTVKVRLSAE
jgi:arylsulfatase